MTLNASLALLLFSLHFLLRKKQRITLIIENKPNHHKFLTNNQPNNNNKIHPNSFRITSKKLFIATKGTERRKKLFKIQILITQNTEKKNCSRKEKKSE